MSVDPARRYLDAKAKLDSAEARVINLASFLTQVANSLQKDYWNFIVSNVQVGFPVGVGSGGAAFSLNADNWPSAQQIAETLAELHSARHAAVNAWSALSPNDRGSLPKPPGGE